MEEGISRTSILFISSAWEPAVDIYEDEKEIKVVVDVAGVDPAQLQITLEGRTLEISGYRISNLQPGLVKIHQMEIDYGRFSRRIQLPIPVVFDSSQCVYKYGFLTITLPKKPKEQAVRIPVETE